MSELIHHPYLVSYVSEDVWRVTWHGNFVDSHPAEIAEQLLVELNRGPNFHADSLIEIDLSQCEAVNSGGLALLVYLRRGFSGEGKRWRLMNVPWILHRMLRLLSLESSFEITARSVSTPTNHPVSEPANDLVSADFERAGSSTSKQHLESLQDVDDLPACAEGNS